jgi:hypothetical protein
MRKATARAAGGALLAVAAVACGGGSAGPSAPGSSPPPGRYASAHFVFHYTALDAGNIAGIAAAVEGERARILADLRVEAMPPVEVTFHADHTALQAAVRPIVGAIPAFASGLVTSSTQIHMISPNAPAAGPLDRAISNLVHEFAHCVSLRVNPSFANRPRWLWEAVALYEARQSVDLRSVPYMAALAPPSFATLSSFDNTRVYDVGYSIAEFIVARWGIEVVSDLVAANGDTAAVLGLPLADFERDWFEFVRARYGF